jgi:hypothetical protein
MVWVFSFQPGVAVPKEITYAFASLGILPDRIIRIQDALNHRSLAMVLGIALGRVWTCYYSNWRRAQLRLKQGDFGRRDSRIAQELMPTDLLVAPWINEKIIPGYPFNHLSPVILYPQGINVKDGQSSGGRGKCDI